MGGRDQAEAGGGGAGQVWDRILQRPLHGGADQLAVHPVRGVGGEPRVLRTLRPSFPCTASSLVCAWLSPGVKHSAVHPVQLGPDNDHHRLPQEHPHHLPRHVHWKRLQVQPCQLPWSQHLRIGKPHLHKSDVHWEKTKCSTKSTKSRKGSGNSLNKK